MYEDLEVCAVLTSEYSKSKIQVDYECGREFVNIESACYKLSDFLDISLSLPCDGKHRLVVTMEHHSGCNLEEPFECVASAVLLDQKYVAFTTSFKNTVPT